MKNFFEKTKTIIEIIIFFPVIVYYTFMAEEPEYYKEDPDYWKFMKGDD